MPMVVFEILFSLLPFAVCLAPAVYICTRN